jgi:hypothetical protein
MSNISKEMKLEEAIALLKDADNCIQAALGAGEECYAIHNTIEDTIDKLSGYAEQLVEMQVTE